ncbi:DUF2478 domain-containing protein [Aestuariispira insulae]|uniref:Uncharacterized protein DUF2478 n=1 Tax=Aestuariispira insulae TaxID=1461337 RepID=A0A3D9HPS2_9PROT|nr:DUF2478 domain-containing protein [Aestuariispira insulae]RED51514.1 uncharacterized protein DUF2478 [Aestuariispira insulae]
MSQQSSLPFAAAVYQPKKTDKSQLSSFVARLQADGVRIAGILQESHIKPGEKTRTIESIDIRTSQRVAIKNPMKHEAECGLDAGNLIETSAILREILDNPPDLVVMEKFGGQEQLGKGLYDEIMQIIAAHIPLILSVPEPALPLWREMSENMGDEIAFSVEAMDGWWSELSANQ